MEIRLLALHRKEQYPGQYAPEITAVVDEVTLDENPEWWEEEVARQKSLVGDDAAAWAILTARLDTDAVMAVLYPSITVPLELKAPDAPQAPARRDADEAAVRAKVASELAAVDPVEWALAGQDAGQLAASIAEGTAR